MAWTDFILPAAMGVAGYFDYKDRNDRRSQMNDSYNAQIAAAEAQAAMAARTGGGSGGGGKNTAAMSKVLNEYYAKSNALLQPYIDSANQTLPGMTKAFNVGVEGMTPLAQQVLSPEYLNSMLTYTPPPQMDLPEYMVGGKK